MSEERLALWNAVREARRALTAAQVALRTYDERHPAEFRTLTLGDIPK